MTGPDGYARQVADIIDGFAYEYCAECGGDAVGHVISPDMFGNAHAWCQYANDLGESDIPVIPDLS